ncbi:UNVERIFIED_CONTAM: hypothetical protein FKN15_026630 [Acipenser sinensis]
MALSRLEFVQKQENPNTIKKTVFDVCLLQSYLSKIGFPLTPPGEESARAALPPEEGPAAPDRTDYDDVGEESPGEGGAL